MLWNKSHPDLYYSLNTDIFRHTEVCCYIHIEPVVHWGARVEEGRHILQLQNHWRKSNTSVPTSHQAQSPILHGGFNKWYVQMESGWTSEWIGDQVSKWVAEWLREWVQVSWAGECARAWMKVCGSMMKWGGCVCKWFCEWICRVSGWVTML